MSAIGVAEVFPFLEIDVKQDDVVNDRQFCDWRPKPSEVRNTEIEWLLAVDELDRSLGSLEKPSLSLGKAYLDNSHNELETGGC